MTFKGKSTVQQKNIRLDTKKPYHFDRYQKRSALSKKEQPKTTGKISRKFEPIEYIEWLLGQQPRAFQLNRTLVMCSSDRFDRTTLLLKLE